MFLIYCGLLLLEILSRLDVIPYISPDMFVMLLFHRYILPIPYGTVLALTDFPIPAA